MKLNVKAFAVTCGLLLGVGLFLASWWAIAWDGTNPVSHTIARVYRGYSLTPVGTLIGLIWGLVDGAIAGALFAWLYNRLVRGSATEAGV